MVDRIGRQIAFTRDYENLGGGPPVWQDVSSCVRKAMEGLPFGNVTVRTDPMHIEILADPLLGKVFYNLFDNALRYGGKGMTEIHVSSSTQHGSRVLVVSDNGEGIKPELLKKIFMW